MSDKQFKTCIVGGYEQYAIVSPQSQTVEFQRKLFPESLLSFLDVDMETVTPLFLELNAGFKRLSDCSASETLRDILRVLDTLAERHIYFELFKLEWGDLIEQPRSMRFLQKYWHQNARHLPEELLQMQRQIHNLFAHVLDIDVRRGPVPEGMAAYAKAGSAFQFLPQSTIYEIWNDTVFAEVLYPKSIPEIISYHLQECVKRELRLRVCRNCGQYFYITGRRTAIYCQRPFGKKGGTCNSVGPVFACAQKRRENEVLMTYRREYKRRFAWINAGRITRDDFRAWSKLASERKKECDSGTISYETFAEWLRQS